MAGAARRYAAPPKLLELSANAAPGPWEWHWRNGDEVAPGSICVRSYTGMLTALAMCPRYGAQHFADDADFIVALVNWFREQHSVSDEQSKTEDAQAAECEACRRGPEGETPSLLPLTKATEQKVKDLEDYTGLIEKVAQWLHDETDHPDSYPDHTWPEDADDDGRREGGFVKIVPKHAQEQFRDIARRLMAWLPAEASLLSSHAREAALVAALEEITAACEADFEGPGTGAFEDQEAVSFTDKGECALTFGMIRRARSALAQITEKAE